MNMIKTLMIIFKNFIQIKKIRDKIRGERRAKIR
jgi:hypothetical protein